jgi:hypothetical protein
MMQAVEHTRFHRPRGESKQDYCTPKAFLDAVQNRFGLIVWDLAATKSQAVCGLGETGHYYGPDHERHQEGYSRRDALKDAFGRENDWSVQHPAGLRWLNPPFAHIAPWAMRCAKYASADRPIAFLVPASIGANWYWDHVYANARTYSVGRMMFVIRHPDGTETPACFDKNGKPTNFNKDLMLCVFHGRDTDVGLERWNWRRST